jgi:hypothetical protein
MDEERTGVVLVGEDFDLDDAFRLTGLFAAHWEALDGQTYLRGPEGVPVEEAIAWGREHADVVLVRLGDEDEPYSAGDKPPDSDPIRQWPRDGLLVRARPVGAALDGSEQVVTYALESTVRGDGVPLDRLRAALDAVSEVANVRVESASPGSVEVRYEVRAAMSEQAMVRGMDALEAVLNQLESDYRGAYVETTAVVKTLSERASMP